MRRIVAFVFLLGVSLLILIGVASPKVQYDGLEKVCFVTSGEVDFQDEKVLTSGNQSYVTVDAARADEIRKQLAQIDGYILYFSPKTSVESLLEQFFDYKNPSYLLAGYTIYDGYTSKYFDFCMLNGRKYNVQLAVTPEAIIVGFPMILTGF